MYSEIVKFLSELSEKKMSIVIASDPNQTLENHLLLNCCIHEGLNLVARIGCVQERGFEGGLNRRGGAANGIPKNLATGAVAAGKWVVVPATGPASICTVGFAACACTERARETNVDRMANGPIVPRRMQNSKERKTPPASDCFSLGHARILLRLSTRT